VLCSPSQALRLTEELLQSEFDDFFLLLAAELQLIPKPFHLGFQTLDLLFMRVEAGLELLLQGRVQCLLDFVAVRLVLCLLPFLDQFADGLRGVCGYNDRNISSCVSCVKRVYICTWFNDSIF